MNAEIAKGVTDHAAVPRTDRSVIGRHWLWLAAVALLTVGVRCVGLLARCVWFDESMSWRTVMLPWPAMIESVRLNTHAPLFFFIFKGWVVVLGESLAALRGLNVVVAVATLPVIALFFRGCVATESSLHSYLDTDERRETKSAFGTEAAGIAMILFAVSPFQIRVASEMRMYPMVSLFALLSSWLLFRAVAHPFRIERWILFAVAALLMMYTHYFGLFFVTAQFLFLGGWLCAPLFRTESGIGVSPVAEVSTDGMPEVDRSTDRMPIPRWWRCVDARAAMGVLVATIVVGLGWLVWLPTFLDQQQRVQDGWWTGRLSEWDFIHVAVDWIASLLAVGGAHGIVAIMFAVLTVVIVTRLLSIGGIARYYLAWMIVFPMIMVVGYSAMKTNLMVSRYFAPVQILWLMGLAITIASIPGGIARYAIRDSVIFLSLAAHAVYLYNEDVWQRGGIRVAVASVENALAPNELVIVDSSLIYFPASFYAHDRSRWRMVSDVNGLTFSTGLPVTQQSDFTLRRDLDNSPHEGLWVVSSRNRFDFVPGSEWQVTDRQYFDGTQPFQETVVVTHFKRAVVPPFSTRET